MSEAYQESTSSTTLYDMLIDQYKLDSHYMDTAVSDLYLAKDTNTQEFVALEVLHPSFSKSYRAAYIAKMEAVSHLKHPNIAPIYNIGTVTDNRPYIAREFIEGYQFSERLKQLEKQNSPANSLYALKMVRELADALALAESHHIYHHYLSPERLVLKYDGTLVLVDLGVPELAGGYKAYKSPTTNNPGYKNEFYLSPEQRNGKEINGRSHVYTLGVILHQLLTGQPPTSPPGKWQKFRNQVPTLQQIRPDLSPHLYELVNKCLHKEAWRRYQSLAELTAVLDATIEAETLFIQTGTTLPGLVTTQDRRPWVYLTIPMILVLICITVAFAIINILNIEDVNYVQQIEKNGMTLLQPNGIETPTSPPVNITTPLAPQETRLNNEQTITNLPEEPAETTIQIVEPLQEQKIEIGSTVVFTWTWPAEMDSDQTFAVYIADENGEQEVGQINQPNNQGVYELVLDSTSFAQDRGIYLWRVVLRDEVENKEIPVSDTTPLRIVLENTPTATNAATVTPTIRRPTVTATKTPISATATIQPTQTPTHTAVPPTATQTVIAPTATATPIPPTATATPTPNPPTATATPIPLTATETPLPTATMIPATATPMPNPNDNPPTDPPPPTAVPPTESRPTSTVPPPPPATSTVPPPP